MQSHLKLSHINDQ